MSFEMDLDDSDWRRQAEEDDKNIQSMLNATVESGEGGGLLDLNRELDVGEKADGAEDFEDISDDDLPEEEEATNGTAGDLPGLTDDGGTSHDTDDLFGEGRDSSPLQDQDDVHIPHPDETESTQDLSSRLNFPSLEEPLNFRDLNFDPDPKQSAEANQDLSIPPPAESVEDLLKQSYPTYQQGLGTNIYWSELFKSKRAQYIPRKPVKIPKPVNPTKVSLDLRPDQEKSFRASGPARFNKRQHVLEAESKGLIPIVEESSDEGTSEPDLDWSTPPPQEQIGGVTWADLQLACNDWEAAIDAEPPFELLEEPEDALMDDEDAEWHREFGVPAPKRQKVLHDDDDILSRPYFLVPSFDDFEVATAHAGKRVVLDLNDPYLLIDVLVEDTSSKRKRSQGKAKQVGSGSLSKSLGQRYNISNDEAYDALKENHQHKVRAMIGNLSVEHSMPALKLQWPYYRVKLHTREARTYHRPALKFNKFLQQNIRFSKLSVRKRKHMKGLSTQDIFKESKDLSLADNSTAMLLEYSEEHPTVLSNFGMGNRILNYYRRKDAEDLTRPKVDIGEVMVLMPEDRSPFSSFGSVDPGETVPTLHNAMYRAPIFKHDPKNTDFLIIRSTTGIGGTSWHIRNIDHLHVVGQQFPSMEIPGPQSRKVTNAAKNRMRMIAFRKLRRNPDHSLSIDEITEHIADSTIMQNRQKLKEFIKYHKEEKVWRVKPGDVIPDEHVVRGWVKPEDVCTIDAMQVGLRHLEDAGYSKGSEEVGSNDEQEGDSLEQRLAPWKTSKNFIDASAGKAMLVLHGEGDPSGHGLAFSFIKTSMKGGYLETVQGPQSTSEDAVERIKKNGGHTYNVAKQNEVYAKAIRDIWGLQKENLSNSAEQDADIDHEHPLEVEDSFGGATASTPANFDDSASQISKFSSGSRHGKIHRIIRTVKDKYGRPEEVSEIVRDHRVWREYIKRRHLIDAEQQNVYEAKPTGDPELDRQNRLMLQKELQRLERNKERRQGREKQKGIFRTSVDPVTGDGSPVETPTDAKNVGTTRKCANCGQVGHIKTNKKLCPLLNGTLKPEDAGGDSGFGAVAAPSFGSSFGP